MPWTFTGYERIPDNPQRWGIEGGARRRLDRSPWAATEKIHGANFCFVIEPGGIRCANRRRLLEPGEDFFGHERVLRRREGALRALGDAALAELGAEKILVYGELFGGGYPHPGVAPCEGVQPVQTGIWYCPDVEFCAFDVAFEREGTLRFLGFGDALARCQAAGLLAAEILARGPYDAVRALSPVFESRVPARLGLPPLPAPNPAEGLVLRPLDAIALPGGGRPLLKVKHPAFAEDERYHQAQSWPEPRPRTSPLDALEWAVLSRLTPPRLASARSKLGPAAPAAALQAELIADVAQDLQEAHGDLLSALSAEDRALLAAVLAEEAAALVRG